MQRNPQFLFNVTPCLVGNLFDVTFDGQGAIIGKRHKPVRLRLGPRRRWIGQNPDGGFVRVAPWIADDPALQIAALTLAARRRRWRRRQRPAAAARESPARQPNAPGACENGYRESVLIADLTCRTAAARTPGPRARDRFAPAVFPLALRRRTQLRRELRGAASSGIARRRRRTGRARRSRQLCARRGQRTRTSPRDGKVYVVWQDSRAGGENIYLGVSMTARASAAARQRQPGRRRRRAAARPGAARRRRGASSSSGRSSARAATTTAGASSWRASTPPATSSAPTCASIAARDGAGKWNPPIAVDGGGDPLVAWVDERDRSPGGLPLEHIYFSRGLDRGRR